MNPIVTAEKMAEMDRYTIEKLKIPGMVLMENAGRGIFWTAMGRLQPNHDRIWIFCGPGNNGGDGYVVARYLINAGKKVRVFVLTSREKISGDALANLKILENIGFKCEFISDCPEEREKPDLIIDAILGTGVKGALRGLFKTIVDFINRQGSSVLAIDIPTGVDADTGQVEGSAVQAEVTATMALKKQGLLFSPGREHAGIITVIDIGLPAFVFEKKKADVFELEKNDILSILPRRAPDTYKNACGTVAVIAGSRGFTGAATLTCQAVLRAGAGLAYLCTPSSLNSVFEGKLTEVITWPFDDAGVGYLHSCFEELILRLETVDVIALGPGLGQHSKTGELIIELVSHMEAPMVVDADGLNILAGDSDLISSYNGPMVLTPHPGELSRLVDKSITEITKNRIQIVKETAQEWQKVLVLKGGPTVIGAPDGRVFINSTGNAGLATGGTGDVLTGTIAALMGQGLDSLSAALTGVYIHGMAGDIAARKHSQRGMIAGDLLASLPQALKLEENDD